MADAKISALTAAGSALGADEVPVNEAGTTKKVTITQIGTLVGIKLANTTVFGPATSPNLTFTDLDLSATVGAVARLVMLRVQYTTANGNATYAFITKGDTGSTTSGANAMGVGGVLIAAGDVNKAYYVLVKTDSAGVVQWTGSGASQAAQLDVIAYW